MIANAITHVDTDELTAAQVIWLAKRAKYGPYKTSWLLHKDRRKVMIVVGNHDGSFLLFSVTADGRVYPKRGLAVERA